MYLSRIQWLPVVVVVLLSGGVGEALAQLGGIGDKFKKKVEKKADAEVDKATDSAVDCMFGDNECIDQAKKDGKTVVIVDKDGKPMSEEQVAAASAGTTTGGATTPPAENDKPNPEVWRNYDFVPGKTVVYASDFSGEKIGRVPADFELVKGNMQLVERGGRRMLEFTESTVFRLPLNQKLTDQVTVEFVAQIAAPNLAIEMFFTPLATSRSKFPSHYVSVAQRTGIYTKGNPVSSLAGRWDLNKSLHDVRFQYDGEYSLLYLDHDRAANLPKANFVMSDVIEFHVTANKNYNAYMTDIVVAVGLDDLYSTLRDKGEFTTRGIYFSSASHEIRPESTPTLEELRKTLADHPELSITIEGHTDDQGETKYNLDLSDRRANAVKDYLTANGIDAKRLKSVGLGEGKPVADNATATGRQENRRVVIRRD